MRNEEITNRKELACGECRERVSFHWYGEEIVDCSFKTQQYGKRCEHFRRVMVKKED